MKISALLAVALALVCAGCATAPKPRPDAYEQAFLVGFPLYEFARVRQAAQARAVERGEPGVNRLVHRPRLSDHTDRNVTTPNNDTLYSAAWLDLSAGPVRLETPVGVERYWSVALLQPNTDNFAVVGGREAATAAPVRLIAGPGWSGEAPAGVEVIRAPTDDVWLLVRVLVVGAEDLPAARAVQARFRLHADAAPDRPFAAATPLAPDPEAFLEAVNAVLGRAPAAARVTPELRAVGLRPGETGVWADLPPAVRRAWTERLPGLYAGLKGGVARLGTTVDGWTYPPPGLGRFGDDHALRAAVAMSGLGALPDDEAVYLFSDVDAEGRLYDGAGVYRLTVPADAPAQAFWALTLYEVTPDGRQFLAANPLGRYSVGDRTPGLTRTPAGDVEIVVSHAPPPDPAANWLPAPPGRFSLTFRAYLPGEALRTGEWRMPGVKRE